MITINRQGITRTVILTKRYAIKLPALRHGWAKFLYGLLSNIDEARFACMANEFALCPTIFAMPGGWLNIQPRCQTLSDAEWRLIAWIERDDKRDTWQGMSCDFKRDNFGTLNGRIVLLDYGQLT
jgi:hypothetical protein